MFDDPKPDDIVQGTNGRTCTVKQFNAMTHDEKLKFNEMTPDEKEVDGNKK